MPSFPGLQDYFDPADVLYEDKPWVVLSPDKLAGYMMQKAVIGHKCDEFDVVQFMDEEDCIWGECWWCKTTIPDNIQFMWQMLNWDKLPDMRRYVSGKEDESKNQTNVHKPMKDKKQSIVGRHTAP